MTIQTASMTVATFDIAAACEFYKKHFDVKMFFDSGDYVVLHFPGVGDGDSPEICFMEPREGVKEFSGGVMFNLRVTDVDLLYARLVQKGIEPVFPLEDHPWGDRGFGILDPCGVVVYCYCDIEPSAEFRQYYIH